MGFFFSVCILFTLASLVLNYFEKLKGKFSFLKKLEILSRNEKVWLVIFNTNVLLLKLSIFLLATMNICSTVERKETVNQ